VALAASQEPQIQNVAKTLALWLPATVAIIIRRMPPQSGALRIASVAMPTSQASAVVTRIGYLISVVIRSPTKSPRAIPIASPVPRRRHVVTLRAHQLHVKAASRIKVLESPAPRRVHVVKLRAHQLQHVEPTRAIWVTTWSAAQRLTVAKMLSPASARETPIVRMRSPVTATKLWTTRVRISIAEACAQVALHPMQKPRIVSSLLLPLGVHVGLAVKQAGPAPSTVPRRVLFPPSSSRRC